MGVGVIYGIFSHPLRGSGRHINFGVSGIDFAVTNESIIDQAYFSKISPLPVRGTQTGHPSLPKRGITISPFAKGGIRGIL